jgi:transcriptional regulator with XRE-family HTH domain
MARPTKGKLSFEQIAEHFGVTAQAVGRWSKAGCPLDSVEAVTQWREALEKRADDLKAAKTRKTRLECERLAVMVQRERGELILRSEVYETGLRNGSMLSAEIWAACADLPAQLVGLPDENAVRVILEKRLNLVLGNFKARLMVK